MTEVTYKTKPCKRCEGKGRLAHFGHVNNGVCLSCHGKGFTFVTKKANKAYVMTRERVGSSFGGWVVIANFWMNADSTEESILAKYIAAGYESDLLAITVKIEDRKIKV